ncbi:MAG: PIG-L family deacetylase [Firmicutes bacterium]|nr:PIG-L family deacetylase [Bacillota bacterium]MCL1953191.1 PIG-L family deacetylase [Bacillota bacterium]
MIDKIKKFSYNTKSTTDLVIAAHFDDVEFMSYSVITNCMQNPNKGMGAVVITDGGGSPRGGKYANITDEQMIELRIEEQKNAAKLGQYSDMIMLMQSSKLVKECSQDIVQQVAKTIIDIGPQVLYTHNIFDKHPTHQATFKIVISALKSLPMHQRPKQLIGCEVWRALDWINDVDKIPMDTSFDHDFARKLFGMFESQIIGGKNYGNAVIGRFVANATFYQTHSVDEYESLSYGLDMTALIDDRNLTMTQLATQHLDNFRDDVLGVLDGN